MIAKPTSKAKPKRGPQVLTHAVTEADEGRVDALVARLLDFSRARVRGLVDHGGVSVNDDPCGDAGKKVCRGDHLKISYDPERQYREKPVERATRGFSIVHLDEHLVVVVKEAGILTVPTAKGETNALVDLLTSHLNKGQAGQGRRNRVSVVHRLDRDTSGLLVFGRTPEIAKAVIAQFAAHKPEREYAAIVVGKVSKDRGEIRSHLETDAALNQKSVRSADGRGPVRGELAITHYEVQARFPDTTLLRVRLETGKRNQIRVHLAELGHPVLGDVRYRPDEAAHPDWRYRRLALHARVLGFRHPVDKRALRFEAPLPAEFVRFEAAQLPHGSTRR